MGYTTAEWFACTLSLPAGKHLLSYPPRDVLIAELRAKGFAASRCVSRVDTFCAHACAHMFNPARNQYQLSQSCYLTSDHKAFGRLTVETAPSFCPFLLNCMDSE
eukprot:1148571-Pelagomonas_calceolata.AAC.2